MHRRARKGIGYLPQEASVFKGLTVWENLMALAELQAIPRAEQVQRCEKLLAEFHLQKVRDDAGHEPLRGRAAALRDGPRLGDATQDHAAR